MRAPITAVFLLLLLWPSIGFSGIGKVAKCSANYKYCQIQLDVSHAERRILLIGQPKILARIPSGRILTMTGFQVLSAETLSPQLYRLTIAGKPHWLIPAKSWQHRAQKIHRLIQRQKKFRIFLLERGRFRSPNSAVVSAPKPKKPSVRTTMIQAPPSRYQQPLAIAGASPKLAPQRENFATKGDLMAMIAELKDHRRSNDQRFNERYMGNPSPIVINGAGPGPGSGTGEGYPKATADKTASNSASEQLDQTQTSEIETVPVTQLRSPAPTYQQESTKTIALIFGAGSPSSPFGNMGAALEFGPEDQFSFSLGGGGYDSNHYVKKNLGRINYETAQLGLGYLFGKTATKLRLGLAFAQIKAHLSKGETLDEGAITESSRQTYFGIIPTIGLRRYSETTFIGINYGPYLPQVGKFSEDTGAPLKEQEHLAKYRNRPYSIDLYFGLMF